MKDELFGKIINEALFLGLKNMVTGLKMMLEIK